MITAHILLWAAVSSSLPCGPPAQEAPDDYPLASILREAHAAEAELLGRRIGSRGADFGPMVFQALRDRTCPLSETGAMVVGPVEEDVLLAGAEALGRSSFALLFENANPEELDADTRRALLQILGRVGRARDSAFLLELALSTDSPEAEVIEAFEDALVQLVARDARVLPGLRARFLDLDPEFACAAARAVAERPSHAGIELLVEMVGFRQALDPVLLSLTTKAAKQLDGPFDAGMRTKVRLSLADTDFQILRKVAMTVAVLEDFEATPILIELLGHEHAGVRDSAHWGLRELTGLALRQDQASWSAWYEREILWYEHEAPLLRRKLVHGNPVQVAEALGELGRHRYERNATADLVADTLHHSNPRIRQRACGVLRQLDARVSLELLIECLDDEDPGVASEAHRALTALTRLSLEPDAEAWRQALQPAPTRP